MATPKDLWREITRTETPDLDTFFARVWKNGLWGFFGPDFAAAWDSNLASFKEQIANEAPDVRDWECRLGLTVTVWIPTDEYDAVARNDMVARIDFHRSETVDLSLEPGQRIREPRDTRQWIGVGAGQRNANFLYDANFDSDRMLEALDARATSVGLMTFRMNLLGMRGIFWGTNLGSGYKRVDMIVDYPLNKLISDVSTHAICYEKIDLEVQFTLGRSRTYFLDRTKLLLPQEYRKPWEASWRTTAQRHALHMRIQPLQDLLAKAASHYTEAQMQSAVSAGRPMPELGRMCREMKDIADEIPGLIENDSLYPLSANYPLIHRRLIDAHRAAYEVFRLCEQPERWNVTTLPLIAQQFGQQAKGLSRTQSQRAELERARAQTQREEMDRGSR